MSGLTTLLTVVAMIRREVMYSAQVTMLPIRELLQWEMNKEVPSESTLVLWLCHWWIRFSWRSSHSVDACWYDLQPYELPVPLDHLVSMLQLGEDVVLFSNLLQWMFATPLPLLPGVCVLTLLIPWLLLFFSLTGWSPHIKFWCATNWHWWNSLLIQSEVEEQL